MSNMDVLKNELRIPEKYLLCTEEKICATVHKKWLTGFLNLNPINFINHDQFSPDEMAAQPSLDELGIEWSRIYIKVGISVNANDFIIVITSKFFQGLQKKASKCFHSTKRKMFNN